jgi:hypothetical protein
MALDQVIQESDVRFARPEKKSELAATFEENAELPSWVINEVGDPGVKYKELFAQLEDYRKKKTPTLVTKSRCLGGTSWDFKHSKNAARDFKPLIQSAIVEDAWVAEYRRDVLEWCPPALPLREDIQQLLSRMSKEKNKMIIADDQRLVTVKVREWRFPDGIEDVEVKFDGRKEEFDVINMMDSVKYRGRRTVGKELLRGIVKKIEAVPFAALDPYQPDVMAPRVHRAVQSLIKALTDNWAVHEQFAEYAAPRPNKPFSLDHPAYSLTRPAKSFHVRSGMKQVKQEQVSFPLYQISNADQRFTSTWVTERFSGGNEEQPREHT